MIIVSHCNQLPYISIKIKSKQNKCKQNKYCGIPFLFAVNCGIRHVTVPIATRILIANVRHIGLSNICVINLVYFKMQVWCLWNRYKATVMLNCSQYGASRLK